MERRQEEMKIITLEIQKNIDESQRKQIEKREKENSKKRKLESFAVGEKVLLYDKSRPKRKAGSLAPRYRGPYTVHEIQQKTGNLKLKNKNGVVLKNWQKSQLVKKFVESE